MINQLKSYRVNISQSFEDQSDGITNLVLWITHLEQKIRNYKIYLAIGWMEFKWLGFQISDFIGQSGHVQTDLFLTIQNLDASQGTLYP